MTQAENIKLVEEALREARWKALHGTPEERAGKYLGRQDAVEQAAARIRAEQGKPR